MTLNQRIFDLMEVEPENHDIDWLKASLQAAVEVEFFTIPPYLAAMWSIDDEFHPISESFKTIVIDEEMLHFGLMCNLLTALREVPKLNVPGHVPTYPNHLPGNINPNLSVSLQGFSTQALETFMAIELPENGSIVGAECESAVLSVTGGSTIGSFYKEILIAFERIQPALSADNQQERLSFGLKKITDMNGVREAISTIKRQGEGASDSPEDTGVDDLAHYYRFAEMRCGRKLKKDEMTGKWSFTGEPIRLPENPLPMFPVPLGGYQSADVPGNVQTLLEEFDRNYTEMLNRLQSAWQGGSLTAAVTTMRRLQTPAVALMREKIVNGTGSYGQCFRLI